jgi:hypothetical protein
MLKKGSVHMQTIIAGIGVFCAFGIVILLSIEDMSGNVKLPIVALLVLIAGYSLTKIQSKETKSGKDKGK